MAAFFLSGGKQSALTQEIGEQNLKNHNILWFFLVFTVFFWYYKLTMGACVLLHHRVIPDLPQARII